MLYDRAFYPAGTSCQLLPSIAMPTLVIHGKEDPLVSVGCGQDLADTVPNADMLVIAGMAQDPRTLSVRVSRAPWPRTRRAWGEHPVCYCAPQPKQSAASDRRVAGC